MKMLIRDNETMKVEEFKVELYKSCGWTVVSEMFTYKNKEEENEAWFKRFGD